MNIHIYVLLLSIWTNNCLNTDETDVSTTTTSGDKQGEPTTSGSKMDDFRKRLLGFIVGIMIIAFTFTCFCLLHYNCMIEDVAVPGALNKENMAAISSWVSKVSACHPDMANEDSLENLPLLFSTEEICGTPSPEKLPIVMDSSEKSVQPSNTELSFTLFNVEEPTKCSNLDKSSITCNIKKLLRQSTFRKSSKTSFTKKLHGSTHLEKSYKKHNLKMSQNLTHASKLVSGDRSPCMDKLDMPPWLALLQSSVMLAKPSHPPLSKTHILSPKPSDLRKQDQSHAHHLKKSVSIGKAIVLSNPKFAKTCHRYQERCLVCNNSDTFSDTTSERRKENTKNLHAASNWKPFLKPVCEQDSKDQDFHDDVPKEAAKIYDSEDSDTEVVIICDMRPNDRIPNFFN